VITADSRPPLWPGELTAWGTLAVAVVAVAVALFAEWRAAVRVTNEREHAAQLLTDEREHAASVLADERKAADDRLTRQLEHSDKQLADERKAADDRLQAQIAHSDEQLQQERQRAQDALQLSEAYGIRVIVGQQDGRITDPNINAGPDDVLRSLVVVVVNEGHYTVTDVAVGLYDSNGSRTDPARTERTTGDLLEGATDFAPRDLGDRMLAPGGTGLRFVGSARLQRNLTGVYPVVRWTDRWGQLWENSKGRVRKTSASTMMAAWY
jgi:hypothetical protein